MRPTTGLLVLVTLLIAALSGCRLEEPSAPVRSQRTPVVTQLTSNSEVFEANPIYSPDGAWILFESDRTGTGDSGLVE
jgi:hypothetical protein